MFVFLSILARATLSLAASRGIPLAMIYWIVYGAPKPAFAGSPKSGSLLRPTNPVLARLPFSPD